MDELREQARDCNKIHIYSESVDQIMKLIKQYKTSGAISQKELDEIVSKF